MTSNQQDQDSVEAGRQLRKVEAERWWEWRITSLVAAKEFGAATVKAMILLNGAALIALASFLGTMAQARGAQIDQMRDQIGVSVVLFILGLVAAVSTSGIAYINFTAIAESLPAPDKLSHYVDAGDVSGWRTGIGRIAAPTAWAAVILTTASIILFLIGAVRSVGVIIGVASGI